MEREWKNIFPKFGNGKGMKKSIPTIQESESEAIIPKNTWEQEQEWKKHNMTINENYLANTWREKEFRPNILNHILLHSW